MSQAANWLSVVLSITKMDLLEFSRQKVVFFSSLFTPVSMVLSFGLGMNNQGSGLTTSNYFTEIIAGIFAISIMFGATYSMGFATIIDRQKRTTEDMFLSAKMFSAFIFARYFAMLLKIFLQFMIVLILVMGPFNYKISSFPMLALAFVNTTLFFSGVGNLIALYATEVSFSSLTNFILMPLFYFGGVFFPLTNFGAAAETMKYVPMAIHVQIFRYATYGDQSFNIIPLACVATLYSIVLLAVTTVFFKRKVQTRH